MNAQAQVTTHKSQACRVGIALLSFVNSSWSLSRSASSLRDWALESMAVCNTPRADHSIGQTRSPQRHTPTFNVTSNKTGMTREAAPRYIPENERALTPFSHEKINGVTTIPDRDPRNTSKHLVSQEHTQPSWLDAVCVHFYRSAHPKQALPRPILARYAWSLLCPMVHLLPCQPMRLGP